MTLNEYKSERRRLLLNTTKKTTKPGSTNSCNYIISESIKTLDKTWRSQFSKQVVL